MEDNIRTITDKVNYSALIGVTYSTPIYVEIVKMYNIKTDTTRCVAYQCRDGLIVAEGPALEKYIPTTGNGFGRIVPDYRYWKDQRNYILECEDLDGYTGNHVACEWEYNRHDPIIVDYATRPLAFDGDVYEFFNRDLDLMVMTLSNPDPYYHIASKCLDFMEANPKATIDHKSKFIRDLLDKYYRAVRDGHIESGYDLDIFGKIGCYLQFDHERKMRNKAKKAAIKRANKAARRAAKIIN